MDKKGLNWFEKIHSIEKLVVCIIIGLIAFLLAFHTDGLTRIMIGWDLFSLSMIVIFWITFGVTNSTEIRSQTRLQDPRPTIVFILVLIATTASITAIILMITLRDSNHGTSNWQVPVAIFGMVLSWILVHTLFTLRYAHIYYGNDVDNPTNHAGGLQFPNDKRPEYLDFAYFSFVLGMTFQVSDVPITSKAIRRLVLFHSLISFAYNTIMIALVINVTV